MNDYGTTIAERVSVSHDRFQTALDKLSRKLRVAIPGVVQSFNATAQTVTVQPALTEVITLDGVRQVKSLPLLVDVPVVLPRAGGFTLTMPIQKGDECLVVFADMCIDAFWQSGAQNGPQNQFEIRRHDLSDGFAIMGCWSQPRKLSSYSTTAAELRSDDGQTKVAVQSTQVTLTATNVTVNATNTATITGQHVNITGTTDVTISGNNLTKIENKTFLTHLHTGVATGGSTSGPVA